MHKGLTSSEEGTSIFSWQEGCREGETWLRVLAASLTMRKANYQVGRTAGAGKPRDYWTGVNPASATSHGAYVVPGSREAEGQALRAIPILAVQESRRDFFRSR